MGKWLRTKYEVSDTPELDRELLVYAITQVDSTSIDKDIHIDTYYETWLKSTGSRGIFIKYDIDNSGELKSWCIEDDIFNKYQKEYKEKVRLQKIYKLLNIK